MFEDAFDVTYSDANFNQTMFDVFSEAVFEFGSTEANEEPFTYGSYEIYEADTENQAYKFISYVNLTSKDAVQLWPQFMYESILKVATDDPEFEFKVRTSGYPIIGDLDRVE